MEKKQSHSTADELLEKINSLEKSQKGSRQSETVTCSSDWINFSDANGYDAGCIRTGNLSDESRKKIHDIVKECMNKDLAAWKKQYDKLFSA